MIDEENIPSAIEALLFREGASMRKTLLAKLLGVNIAIIDDAIKQLKSDLHNRGIILVELDDTVALRTSPQFSELLHKTHLENNSGDIGKAALEVLSVILYKENPTLADIDYIRGVNSAYSVRRLLTRGLIEAVSDKNDSRRKIYRPTVELLSYMGITDISDLPGAEIIRKQIKEFENGKDDE